MYFGWSQLLCIDSVILKQTMPDSMAGAATSPLEATEKQDTAVMEKEEIVK